MSAFLMFQSPDTKKAANKKQSKETKYEKPEVLIKRLKPEGKNLEKIAGIKRNATRTQLSKKKKHNL